MNEQKLAIALRLARIATQGLSVMYAADRARAAGAPFYAGIYRVQPDGWVETFDPGKGWVRVPDHDDRPAVHEAFDIALMVACLQEEEYARLRTLADTPPTHQRA